MYKRVRRILSQLLEMATDTDFHHNSHCHSLSLPSSQSQNPQAVVSVSEILLRDSGSISFGRFTADSLAWEKWSAFSHDRCKEELEKFKVLGFVAQKKAYFEEYYKRIRAMKASQLQEENTTGLVTLLETSTNDSQSNEDRKYSYARQVQILDDDVGANSDSSLESIVLKQTAATRELLSKNKENDSIPDETNESLCASGAEQPIKHTTNLHAPTTKNSEIVQLESLVANSVKVKANKPKTQANVACSQNRANLGSINTNKEIKLTEKKKTPPHDKLIGKCSTSKAAFRNNSILVSSRKQLTQVSSRSTSLHASLVSNRLESSSSTGGKTGKIKANSPLADKLLRSLPGHRQSAQCSLDTLDTVSGDLEHKGSDMINLGSRNTNVDTKLTEKKILSPRDKFIANAESRNVVGKCSISKAAMGNNILVSSRKHILVSSRSTTSLRASLVRNRLESSFSTGGKTSKTKANSTLADTVRRSLPAHRQSSQCNLDTVTVSGDLKHRGSDNRPRNLHNMNKSQQSSRVESSQRSYDKERKQYLNASCSLGEDKSKSTTERSSKFAPTMPSSSRNTLTSVQKNVTQPTSLTHAQKERCKMLPCWR
ncbi:hypothetical protein F8388_001706 [Cannabis sativa]|uniref:Protein WVD2-like 7 n=1 Tax=Cannabis sativa TaxID=3483 RepID=A0A7J6HL08_CANSA|nr:hypothetical protein F8388_001706 [Cannabis sativa]